MLIEPLIRAADGKLSLGRYVLSTALEQRGWSMIYGGFDPESDHDVTIELRATTPEEQVETLEAASTLVGLKHPNVLAVQEAGAYVDARDSESVGVFVVMQPIHGLTFDRWLEARPTATRTGAEVEQLLSIFVQAGRGLSAAHEVGVVHGGFSPSSVVIGYDGQARVRNFGFEPESETAPELATGDEPTAASDQYAFCAALQHALQLVGGRAPRRVQRALARGLSPDPYDRFGSMNQLVAELLRKPLRRLRPGALGAAAVAFAPILDVFRG